MTGKQLVWCCYTVAWNLQPSSYNAEFFPLSHGALPNLLTTCIFTSAQQPQWSGTGSLVFLCTNQITVIQELTCTQHFVAFVIEKMELFHPNAILLESIFVTLELQIATCYFGKLKWTGQSLLLLLLHTVDDRGRWAIITADISVGGTPITLWRQENQSVT